MRDNSQLIQQPALTICQVFALYGNDNDYTTLGSGSIEIVTDTDLLHSMCHHYIEVSSPEDNEIFMRSRLQHKNVYERQKSTLILWNDPEQVASNNLAISFEDDRTCDIIWRIICQKIGKNYLQINGQEKLDAPTERNIRYFLQKIKTSYNLVTYHVINSVKFMQTFWQTVDKLNQKNVNNLSGLGLLRELLCRLDVSMMEALLSDPNFKRFLGAFECNFVLTKVQTKAQYYNNYKEPTYDYELIKISPIFKKNFLIFLRAYFVRQHVINFAKDITIELTLLKVIKNTQMEMLNEIILHNAFSKIMSAIQQKKKTKDQNRQDYDLFINKILTFFLESFWAIKSSHAHSFMPIYVEYFNNSKILKILVDLLNQGYHKALEVIAGFAGIGVKSFILVYQEDYRNNPGTSIVRSISKQFSQSPHSQIVDQTISFMKVFLRMLTQDKSKFQFFNKTLILSIFISCNKYPERVLTLINFCINQLGAIKSMFEHIVKYKYFNKLAQRLQKKQQSKQQTVETIQLVRVVLQCMKQEKIGAEAQKEINESAVVSGIFTSILLRLKENSHYNNVLTSVILECLRVISVLKYNEFTKVVQNFDFGDLEDKKYKTLKKYVDKIGQIIEPQQSKDENSEIGKKRIHQSILEQQLEQKYLQDDKEQQVKDSENISTQNLQEGQYQKKLQSQRDTEAQIRNLLKMKKELQMKEIEEEETKRKKQLKSREEKLKAQKNIDDSFKFDIGDLGELQ